LGGGFGFDKAALDGFSLGMATAVVDTEFAEIADGFAFIVDLEDHFKVAAHNGALFVQSWGRGYGLSGKEGTGFIEYPGIADGAAGDDDTIEAGLLKAAFDILGSEEITTAKNKSCGETLFYLFEDIPIGLSAIALADGTAMDDEGIDIVPDGLVADVPEVIQIGLLAGTAHAEFHQDRAGDGLTNLLVDFTNTGGVV
jgi:hypothetical protein